MFQRSLQTSRLCRFLRAERRFPDEACLPPACGLRCRYLCRTIGLFAPVHLSKDLGGTETNETCRRAPATEYQTHGVPPREIGAFFLRETVHGHLGEQDRVGPFRLANGRC